MLQHSRYIEYAQAVAERDHMIGLMLIYVLCAFALAYAVNSFIPRIKAEWVLGGAFYASFIAIVVIPAIAGS